MDAKGNNWDEIPDGEEEDGTPSAYRITTNDVGQTALDMGCDGAIIRNVTDYGESGDGGPADVFIVFSPSQIKSTSNIGTYSHETDIRASTKSERKKKK